MITASRTSAEAGRPTRWRAVITAPLSHDAPAPVLPTSVLGLPAAMPSSGKSPARLAPSANPASNRQPTIAAVRNGYARLKTRSRCMQCVPYQIALAAAAAPTSAPVTLTRRSRSFTVSRPRRMSEGEILHAANPAYPQRCCTRLRSAVRFVECARAGDRTRPDRARTQLGRLAPLHQGAVAHLRQRTELDPAPPDGAAPSVRQEESIFPARARAVLDRLSRRRAGRPHQRPGRRFAH